jgi:hypothetical protein
MSTRRKLLEWAASAAALSPAGAQEHRHSPELVQVSGTYKPKTLKPAQMEWVARMVDLIIPRTDTPGASDAGVPIYIDRVLSRNAQARSRFLSGMTELDAASRKKFGAVFSRLDSSRQTELLTAVSGEKSPAGRFFKQVKDLTIEGYYTSKTGLAVELGWNANTFLPEFKGCEHPEHQG